MSSAGFTPTWSGVDPETPVRGCLTRVQGWDYQKEQVYISNDAWTTSRGTLVGPPILHDFTPDCTLASDFSISPLVVSCSDPLLCRPVAHGT